MPFSNETPAYDPTDPSMQLPAAGEDRDESEAGLDTRIESDISELAELAATHTLRQDESARSFLHNLHRDVTSVLGELSEAPEETRVAAKAGYLAKLGMLKHIVLESDQSFGSTEEYRNYLIKQGVQFESPDEKSTERQTAHITFTDEELTQLCGIPSSDIAKIAEPHEREETQEMSTRRVEEAKRIVQELKNSLGGEIIQDPWGRYHGLRTIWRVVLKEVNDQANSEQFIALVERNNQLRSNRVSSLPIALGSLSELCVDEDLQDEFGLASDRLLAKFHGTEPGGTKYSSLEIGGKIAVAKEFEKTAANALLSLKAASDQSFKNAEN